MSRNSSRSKLRRLSNISQSSPTTSASTSTSTINFGLSATATATETANTRGNTIMGTHPHNTPRTPRRTPLKPHSHQNRQQSITPTLPDPLIGSLPYIAPEILRPINPVNHLSSCTDTWAFGIMVFAMICLKLPFHHGFEPRLKLMILNSEFDLAGFKEHVDQLCDGDGKEKEEGEKARDGLIEVLTGCLEKDPEKRMNMKEVVRLLSDL
ncbi:unnamed protein product [Ambrosiozyma monospora]|uniref:non-specific serine/threonine protein kinase n=1 Tax=Ambrosiozyma monospora TaxID=43982 RepID=A0A9W6SXA0_AMBMO|nr:unnamed protein product [Ambrosiozyma monospora]